MTHYSRRISSAVPRGDCSYRNGAWKSLVPLSWECLKIRAFPLRSSGTQIVYKLFGDKYMRGSPSAESLMPRPDGLLTLVDTKGLSFLILSGMWLRQQQIFSNPAIVWNIRAPRPDGTGERDTGGIMAGEVRDLRWLIISVSWWSTMLARPSCGLDLDPSPLAISISHHIWTLLKGRGYHKYSTSTHKFEAFETKDVYAITRERDRLGERVICHPQPFSKESSERTSSCRQRSRNLREKLLKLAMHSINRSQNDTLKSLRDAGGGI